MQVTMLALNKKKSFILGLSFSVASLLEFPNEAYSYPPSLTNTQAVAYSIENG